MRLNGEKINFVESAENVGMPRSSLGISPTILARLPAHRNALNAVLHTGMARGHRGNPAASLKIEQLYALPVLLSGLAPLFLTKKEEGLINQHHKDTILNLQRLLPCTPTPVVLFLAGTLPGSAHLHLRQLTNFGMITRLSDNILHKHALNIFQSGTPPTKSWFHQIHVLCNQYHLPTPLYLLQFPMLKAPFKNLIKKKVINYWELVLRAEASLLKSLIYFKSNFMSLTQAHPIWTTAGSSPSKVTMATIQARMLSGRYRTESLCSHWKTKKTGVCLLSPDCSSSVEDIHHILSTCSALTATREKLMSYAIQYSSELPVISQLILKFCTPSSNDFCQFLLDCSPLSEVISATRLHGSEVHHHLFNITRTWVYTLHKERMKILGRWNII